LFYNTVIVEVKYITIEIKEAARIGYSGFIFSHSLSGEGLGDSHLGIHQRKRNPLYPMRAISFLSIVLYLMLIPVIPKQSGSITTNEGRPGEMNSIQNCVIKFDSDLRQVRGFPHK
jgi:hypothetical protein